MAGQIGLIRQIGVIGLIGGLGGLGARELRSIFRLCGMPATCAYHRQVRSATPPPPSSVLGA